MTNVHFRFLTYSKCRSKQFFGVQRIFCLNVYKFAEITFFYFWWRQLAAGRSLNCAPCRDSWCEHSCPRSAMAIHSVAVDRTSNLPVGKQTLYHWAICRPKKITFMRQTFSHSFQ